MGYNKKFLSMALAQTKSEGEKARRLYDARLNEVRDRHPRLSEIEAELMKIGPMLGLSALGGYEDRVIALKEKSAALAKEKQEILKEVGLSKFAFKCKVCEDTGYVGTNLCDCVLKRAKELSFKALSEEMPITESRFDNFDLKYYKTDEDKAVMEKIFNFCIKYARELSNSSQSLMFFGGTGLGKTHLSLAIASVATEKGMGVVYSPVQNLLHKLEREHFSYSADTPLLDDVLECDLLIMDDLGAEFSTSFTGALIYNIINTRILSGKPTIISTNLAPEELGERYTPRVASRIFGCYNLKSFCGSDIRQQKRLEELRKI